MDRSIYSPLLERLKEECLSFYGPRLVTLAIFGSYARNQMREDSDLDIFLIAEGLPDGRMKRSAEFREIEKKLESIKSELSQQDLYPCLSAIFKTPEEALRGSPIFLDMTQEIEMLYDRNGFFKNRLERLKNRLKELGSQRIWKGTMWYWVLKPDFKPGEIIEL